MQINSQNGHSKPGNSRTSCSPGQSFTRLQHTQSHADFHQPQILNLTQVTESLKKEPTDKTANQLISARKKQLER